MPPPSDRSEGDTSSGPAAVRTEVCGPRQAHPQLDPVAALHSSAAPAEAAQVPPRQPAAEAAHDAADVGHLGSAGGEESGPASALEATAWLEARKAQLEAEAREREQSLRAHDWSFEAKLYRPCMAVIEALRNEQENVEQEQEQQLA